VIELRLLITELFLMSARPKKLVQKYIGAEVIELDMGADKNYWLSRIQGLNFQEFENKIFIFFQSIQDRQNFTSQIQNSYYLVRAANLNDVFLKVAGYQIRGGS
jgi:hypothetical protein